MNEQTEELDISDHWADEDYRDFSEASFVLIEERLNEEAAQEKRWRLRAAFASFPKGQRKHD